MICSLCTMETIKGTMFRTRPVRGYVSGFILCDTCRSAVQYSEPEEINEPLCECGKLPEWACRARLDKENCGANTGAGER